MIESKTGQRIAGLFFLVVGGGFTAWSWYTALNEGYYYRKAVALFPALAVGGLWMLLFPMDMAQLRAKHGVEKPQQLRFAHYPMSVKVMVVVGILVGLGNWWLISRW